MKIVVVGGVAGGASAAARIKRLNDHAEIIVFERGNHVSYSNCAIPYYIGGHIPSGDHLVLMAPQDFKDRFDIEVRTNSEVININRQEKTVTVKEKDGKEYKESYDKLVLSPGAEPIAPPTIKGIDSKHVFKVRNVTDAVNLKTYIEENKIQDIAVIGGGFIGIEIAENLKELGKNVKLIEGQDQILAPFDYDMVQILHKELLDNKVDLYLSSMLEEIQEDKIIANKNGQKIEIKAQAVVLSIGVKPETALAEKANLEIGKTGAIKVNSNYQTNDQDIYAVGDAIEIYHKLSQEESKLPLAGPAQRQARAAADHICGKDNKYYGYIGSSCLKVFNQNAASTGLNHKAATKQNIPCDYVYILPPDKVGLMPGSNYMAFKLLFEVPTGRILGAQAIGKGNVTKRIDTIATLITMNGTLEDLKNLELCYSPVYSTAKDIVNMAALVGLNILSGRVKQVHVDQVRSLVESDACIIDVREKGEYNAGHLNNSKNIPLTEFSKRIDEIPKDKPVYLHCRTSQRSYYAICKLLARGYTNVYNISGSYLGISLYEYFNDQDQKRKPILTAYNFN